MKRRSIFLEVKGLGPTSGEDAYRLLSRLLCDRVDVFGKRWVLGFQEVKK